ncbi:MAG: glycosyltransferase [Verrucomicrobia bacterium]|nr:glycosyltransferase [Verrucomicrobiota bacterium]
MSQPEPSSPSGAAPALPRWFTCAPLPFDGNTRHFARDSGLLCKGFQEIGIPCKAILPGKPRDDDQTEDLIRTDYENLTRADWWRSLNGTGVVFYGWGDGRYLPIVKAIKEAGLFLVTNLDTGGLFSMAVGVRAYTGSLWRGITGREGINPASLFHVAWRTLYSLTLFRWRVDRPRIRHLQTADVIGSISPLALERIRKYCRTCSGEALASKVKHVPHANASYMRYDPSVTKECLVIAVGRWDDEKIKGTALLVEVIRETLRRHPAVVFEIYGPLSPKIEDLSRELPDALKPRLRLVGTVPNLELRRACQRARISLCTSLAEGYHTVSAEALCSGCSVVGPDIPEIPSMQWFTEAPYGTRAPRNARALSDALIHELSAWENRERDPQSISAHWTAILHAPRVAERILKITKEIRLSKVPTPAEPIRS